MAPQAVPDVLGGAAQLVLATVFVHAATAKLRSPADLRRTLERLGVWPALAGGLAASVIAAELAAGLGLLAVPSSPWPRVLVVLLGFGFAAAGLAALASRQQIACACFGGSRPGRLGWRQVAWLPVWLALAAMAQWRPPGWSLEQGLLGVSLLALGLLAWQLPAELRIWRQLRGDRLAVGDPPMAPVEATVGSEGEVPVR